MSKRFRETDDKTLRTRNIRLRFKRLVRAVTVNLQWLDEPEEQGIVMNAKKNVAFLIRQKRKIGLLTVAEKALLRTPHLNRTIEERKKLCMIVSALPCFGNIPPKLRARLIPVLNFATISGDRVLMKKGDMPLLIYFMISGEIEMKKPVYDKNTKKMSMVSEAIIGSGDWIGEVELLEDCTRLNTYVAQSPCEVLSITESDFIKILGPFMQKQWHEKKMALKSSTYFDFLTDKQIVRACSCCRLVQYDPLQSIYSEDGGAISCVHFILSGECVILQCLKMTKRITKGGKNTFQLVKVQDTSQSLFESTSKTLRSRSSTFMNQEHTKSQMLSDFNINDLLLSLSDTEDEEALQMKKARRKIGLLEIEAACGLAGRSVPTDKLRKMQPVFKKKTKIVARKDSSNFPYQTEEEECMGDDCYDFIEEEEFVEEAEIKTKTHLVSILKQSSARGSSKKASSDLNPDKIDSTSIAPSSSSARNYSVRIETDDLHNELESDSDKTKSSGSSQSELSDAPNQIAATETHFIDVGSLTYGGIFGLGEKMAHRVIMARTVVQCLLLPRFWLFEEEQNPGHVWQRRRFYLEGSIPSREALFSDFLKQRRWEKFKKVYVHSTLNPNSVNGTHLEDIPIICRIVETKQ